MKKTGYFSKELFSFLKELRDNNDRDWFLANKARYEAQVRDPFLRFIADLSHHLHKISPHLVADPHPAGGSMFRIYRDIRFSKDKSPYKTHVAAHFPHVAAGKKVHVPGFYLHFEPKASFAGAGLWHPDAATLKIIRQAIVRTPKAWEKIRPRHELEGDTLARPPRGYNPDHPFIEDLKRKDFVITQSFTDAQILAPSLLSDYLGSCRAMSPLVEFLSKALGLRW